MNLVARAFLTLVLLGVLTFCVFGFLASYEVEGSTRWPWQLGYGVGASVCVFCMARVWRRSGS